MATIQAQTDERVFQIKKWTGLNENPDGDTKLALGEAAVMRNFRITRDNNLQRRSGTERVKGLLQSYTRNISTTPEIVRVDKGICGTLRMFPTSSVETDGSITLSGAETPVTYENAGECTGYFWRQDDYHVWQLVSCVFDGEETYTWTMYRVTAESTSTNKAVAGLWHGNVGGTEYLVGACDGKIWKLHDGTDFCKVEIGSMATTGRVHFFGYSGKMYAMNGTQYKEWDGTNFTDVVGYRPLVSVSVAPAGGGTTLEQVNKLTGQKRCWFTPDGTSTEFYLPEQNLASIDYVKDRATDTELSVTKDLAAGKITFATAPTNVVNGIEVGWTVTKTDRNRVLHMRYSETYNGSNDNRVFLYGDGTNQALYSGLDYDGKPRADYFPDLNVLDVGEANTPITGITRHFSRLVVFKTNATYSVAYGQITLATGLLTAGFYVTPVNKAVGNEAMGQVALVLNNPRTLHGKDLFEWKSNSGYSGLLSVDERQARRISDRIYATLAGFEFRRCTCYDDNDAQEYYIVHGKTALVHNYAADAWFVYTNFDANCFANLDGTLYFGTSDGDLCRLEYSCRSDRGENIESYWESGSISFDRDFMRKYSAMIWVVLKPEERGDLQITIQTDRKSLYDTKNASSDLSTFDPVDFARWSFVTNRKPHSNRVKLKAKKFVFYKLVFTADEPDTTATVLSADIRVRYTGYAK